MSDRICVFCGVAVVNEPGDQPRHRRNYTCIEALRTENAALRAVLEAAVKADNDAFVRDQMNICDILHDVISKAREAPTSDGG